MTRAKLLSQVFDPYNAYTTTNNIADMIVASQDTHKTSDRTNRNGRIVLCCNLLFRFKRHPLAFHSGSLKLDCPIKDHIPHLIDNTNKNPTVDKIDHFRKFNSAIFVQGVNQLCRQALLKKSTTIFFKKILNRSDGLPITSF
ncbi:hypothetical protein CJ014_20460 [Pleomorphomonas carboxyditropha]|uniref:Uncharacterized protein n=1 Tax=Pleomorphomonas carboxyditropha TaxID=2023338 RepID=A0A2G9WTD9_9HYPH|nr:hypothetical protein CJ014_20460 [Pleomorphomonas carboxyditropha]